MSYKKIMNIGFVIRDKKKGCIIIGGIDDKFLVDELDIIGKNIIVKNSVDEFKFKVKSIDISTSITGKVNIGLILFDSANFYKILAGDEVLKFI